jgi:hypothetical protein
MRGVGNFASLAAWQQFFKPVDQTVKQPDAVFPGDK